MLNVLRLILPVITLSLALTIEGLAQNGWRSGRYYAQKGSRSIDCGSTYIYRNTDGMSSWNEGWQSCRERIWYKEYRKGYIYLWGNHGWYTEWREGYFWYFTWRNFNRRVW